MKIENSIGYKHFIFIGIIMSIGTLIKLLGFLNFSSDWFWFLAGVGLTVEGMISFSKQKKFDKKYRVIEKESSN
jgi:hypothetical protein